MSLPKSHGSRAQGASSPSRRFHLDEAEAQLRVAQSPYTTDTQRVERFLWAAFLATRHAAENPICLRCAKVLRRSAQGFVTAWNAISAGHGQTRVFYVDGERFEVWPPEVDLSELRRPLRWAFAATELAGRRTYEVRLLRRHAEQPLEEAPPAYAAAAPATAPQGPARAPTPMDQEHVAFEADGEDDEATAA